VHWTAGCFLKTSGSLMQNEPRKGVRCIMGRWIRDKHPRLDPSSNLNRTHHTLLIPGSVVTILNTPIYSCAYDLDPTVDLQHSNRYSRFRSGPPIPRSMARTYLLLPTQSTATAPPATTAAPSAFGYSTFWRAILKLNGAQCSRQGGEQ
jgi:hypothetical protein